MTTRTSTGAAAVLSRPFLLCVSPAGFPGSVTSGGLRGRGGAGRPPEEPSRACRGDDHTDPRCRHESDPNPSEKSTNPLHSGSTGAGRGWRGRKKKTGSTWDSDWTQVSSTSTSLSHTVSSLTNGTAYTFKVRAVNSIGTGPASPESDAVTAGADGATTTVHLPFLTTGEGYNQRIVVVNRGAEAAGYRLDFTTEDEVTATAGTDASGVLAGGETTTLSLRNDDVVTLEGGTRVSATLTVTGADPVDVDVATVLVNRNDGGADVVHHRDRRLDGAAVRSRASSQARLGKLA